MPNPVLVVYRPDGTSRLIMREKCCNSRIIVDLGPGGSVQLPREVRERLGLTTGAEICFSLGQENTVVGVVFGRKQPTDGEQDQRTTE